jgi:hypothetical protein
MSNAFLIKVLTVVSVICPMVVHAEGLSCRRVFADPYNVNQTLADQLVELRHSLKALRSEIKEAADSKDPMSALNDVEVDPREVAFLLQGSYRLILSNPAAKDVLKDGNFKIVNKGLNALKDFEKSIGEYNVKVELLKTAKKSKMPEDFVDYLKSERRKLSKKLYRELKEDDYLDKDVSAVIDLSKKIQKFQIPENINSRTWIRDSLKSEIERINEKVDSEMAPLIRAKVYSYHEIENGAHAFRRSLRWLKVYIESYADFFTLVKTSPSEPTVAIYADKFKLQYNEPGKIPLRDIDYAKIIEAVDVLRKIKKSGEMKELLTQELVAFGRWDGRKISSAEAVKIIEQYFNYDSQALQSKSQEILADFESRNGMRSIIMEKGEKND